jgi:hypothetical protein
VFDNDGTLWSEQPAYFQAFYIVDRIKALASEHPDWKEKEPKQGWTVVSMKDDWKSIYP